MKSFYDPPEEVAWGPLTLQEVKAEFSRTPKKISRRHSDLQEYSSKPSKRGSSLLLELNDTVKEMETALKHGLNHPTSDSDEEKENKTYNKDGGFKVPEAPKTIGEKYGKNKYQHVVSPVALYIKNQENFGGRKLCKSAETLVFKNK